MTKEYSAAIIDENGRMVDSLLYFPQKPDGVADAVHALACTGTTASMPSGEFARCVAYDGGVDFYTITNDMLKHVNRFSLFNMEYDIPDQGIPVPVPSEKSKTGFSAVKSSGDRFYASFSDKPGFENPEGLCDKIYRFSRDGHLEQVYAFDCEFADFSVDAANNQLLLLTRENENDFHSKCL